MSRHNYQLNTRNRAVSAKTNKIAAKPIPSYLNHHLHKTQTIQEINNQDTSFNRKITQKSLVYQGINTQELPKYKKTASFITSKDRQQLFDENIKLKKQNNRLSQQLQILKGRLEARGRKLFDRNKQLDMQFQKPLYWCGSKTHVISGIKSQYDKLCKEYSILEQQLKKTKIALLESKRPETEVYIKQIEQQNVRLKNRVEKLLKAQDEIPSKSNNQILSYLYSQCKQHKDQLKGRINELKQNLDTRTEQVKQKEKKILFLQKLLIQKENFSYHLHRQKQKCEKQLSNKLTQIQSLNQTIITKQSQFKTELCKLSSQLDYNHQQQIKIYHQNLQKQQRIIKNLQQETKRMNKLRMKNTTGYVLPSNKSMIVKRTNNYEDELYLSPKKQPMIQSKSSSRISVLSNDQSEHKQQEEKGIAELRVRQCADKRHSEQAKKCRKVQFEDVREIGYFLKYRMMGNQVDLQKLKSYFSYKFEEVQQVIEIKEDEEKESKSCLLFQSTWKQDYITMKQVQQIIQKQPFGLSDQYAQLLSRYLVEDSNQEYVYCDDQNQNKREVVKSIIKSLVGDYQLIKQKQHQALSIFMRKYSNNLEASLRSYYPNGYISLQKFIQILVSLGFKNFEGVKDLMVSRLVKQSQNLETLYYPQLFKDSNQSVDKIVMGAQEQ